MSGESSFAGDLISASSISSSQTSRVLANKDVDDDIRDAVHEGDEQVEVPNVSITNSATSGWPRYDRSGGISPFSHASSYPQTTSTVTGGHASTAGTSDHRKMRNANFLCPVPGCGSSFTRSFDLKGAFSIQHIGWQRVPITLAGHMRAHNEERGFQCKWPGCGKHFAQEQDYKRHEQLHSSYRPYSCEGCGKTFARLDALNRHREYPYLIRDNDLLSICI